MKYLYLTALLIGASLLRGQSVTTFEAFGLARDTFLNGATVDRGFVTDDLFLPNAYDDEFDSWSGWAISTMTDSTTAGFGNQYSAITGGGANGSDTYAVSFAGGGGSVLRLTEERAPAGVLSLFLTNSTYAYRSMREGDPFAKRFGGASGNDPDFLLLTIRGYQDDRLTADSVDFYLADYRFEDNSQDYIVDDWTLVNLGLLGVVDSLQFTLSGSDVGQFGLNTPAYFCVDDVSVDATVATRSGLVYQDYIEVFPNPVRGRFTIRHDLEDRRLNYVLVDAVGRRVAAGVVLGGGAQVRWDGVPGVYTLVLRDRAARVVAVRRLLRL